MPNNVTSESPTLVLSNTDNTGTLKQGTHVKSLNILFLVLGICIQDLKFYSCLLGSF